MNSENERLLVVKEKVLIIKEKDTISESDLRWLRDIMDNRATIQLGEKRGESIKIQLTTRDKARIVDILKKVNHGSSK